VKREHENMHFLQMGLLEDLGFKKALDKINIDEDKSWPLFLNEPAWNLKVRELTREIFYQEPVWNRLNILDSSGKELHYFSLVDDYWFLHDEERCLLLLQSWTD
jgi:hypothetical protein